MFAHMQLVVILINYAHYPEKSDPDSTRIRCRVNRAHVLKLFLWGGLLTRENSET